MLLKVIVKDRDELSKVVDSIHKINGVIETETLVVRTRKIQAFRSNN